MRCEKCGRQLGRYARGKVCRDCRRYGAKSRAALESEPRPTKTCEHCGAVLSPRARSPLCATCRQRIARERRKAQSVGRCRRCGKALGVRNTSGLCVACFRKSKDFEQYKSLYWLSGGSEG